MVNKVKIKPKLFIAGSLCVAESIKKIHLIIRKSNQ